MHRNQSERGQSVVIIMFIVLVILALLALVVDVGNAYAQRRRVQNAVDASAMACAARLAQQGPLVDCSWGPCRQDPVTDDQIEDLMRDYAELNGVERTQIEGTYLNSDGSAVATVGSLEGGVVPYNAMGVRVHGDLTFSTYFAHLLGVDQITVDAPGAAYVLTGPCSNDGLFPMTVSMENFANDPGGRPVIGDEYVMWDQTDKLAPGNFGWVYWVDNLDNNHCPDGCTQLPSSLSANINDTSRSGTWTVDEWVRGSVGVNFQTQLWNNQGNNGPQMLQYYVESEPWPVAIIPLYDAWDGGGGDNAHFRIAGFGAFQLQCAYNAQGPNQSVERFPGACDACGITGQCIVGQFVQWIDEPFEDGCLDTGLTAPSYRRPVQP